MRTAQAWLEEYAQCRRKLEAMLEKYRVLYARATAPHAAHRGEVPALKAEGEDFLGRDMSRLDSIHRSIIVLRKRERVMRAEREALIERIACDCAEDVQGVMRGRFLDLRDWESLNREVYGDRLDFASNEGQYLCQVRLNARMGLTLLDGLLKQG